MNSTMNPTPTINPSTSDAAFFELVGDIDVGRVVTAQLPHRGIEWARFADHLRAAGHSITVGTPA